MIQLILSILAAALSLYTLLCFVYILMSWFPGARFTKFGHFMTAICEPYMGIFRKMSFLRISNIDFSPIVSIPQGSSLVNDLQPGREEDFSPVIELSGIRELITEQYKNHRHSFS